MKSETTIFATPPQEEDHDVSQEEKADEDSTEFDLNNLGQKLQCAEAETY